MNESPDGSDFPALLAQGRFSFMQLAQALLDCDLVVAGWTPAAVHSAMVNIERGARLCLEIVADGAGAATIALVCIEPTGERHTLDVRSDPVGAAN